MQRVAIEPLAWRAQVDPALHPLQRPGARRLLLLRQHAPARLDRHQPRDGPAAARNDEALARLDRAHILGKPLVGLAQRDFPVHRLRSDL